MNQPKMKKIFTMPPGKAEYEYAVKCRFCNETYRIDMNWKGRAMRKKCCMTSLPESGKCSSAECVRSAGKRHSVERRMQNEKKVLQRQILQGWRLS